VEWLPRVFVINVLGNTGEVTVNLTGPVKSISIKPPGSLTFDFEVYDSDGCYLISLDDAQGQQKITVDEIVSGQHTFKVSDAPDGEYFIKIRWSKL
jgi:hypothetical protein